MEEIQEELDTVKQSEQRLRNEASIVTFSGHNHNHK